MNTPPGSHSVNRLIEWFFASVLVGNAIITALTFGHVQDGALKYLNLGDATIVLFFGAFGLMRMFALHANGRWPTFGPWLRAIGSLFGALVWGNLLFALLAIYYQTGTLFRAAIVTYVCATMFELLSCHRAANDSRIGYFKS